MAPSQGHDNKPFKQLPNSPKPPMNSNFHHANLLDSHWVIFLVIVLPTGTKSECAVPRKKKA